MGGAHLKQRSQGAENICTRASLQRMRLHWNHCIVVQTMLLKRPHLILQAGRDVISSRLPGCLARWQAIKASRLGRVTCSMGRSPPAICQLMTTSSARLARPKLMVQSIGQCRLEISGHECAVCDDSVEQCM